MSLSKEVFSGHYDKELFDEYRQWLFYITDLYLPIADSETGDFLSLPFEGAIADQPYMTMQVLKVIQASYRKHLSDNVKRIQTRSGRRSK